MKSDRHRIRSFANALNPTMMSSVAQVPDEVNLRLGGKKGEKKPRGDTEMSPRGRARIVFQRAVAMKQPPSSSPETASPAMFWADSGASSVAAVSFPAGNTSSSQEATRSKPREAE